MNNIILTIFDLFSTTIFLIIFFFHDFFNTKSKLILIPFFMCQVLKHNHFKNYLNISKLQIIIKCLPNTLFLFFQIIK